MLAVRVASGPQTGGKLLQNYLEFNRDWEDWKRRREGAAPFAKLYRLFVGVPGEHQAMREPAPGRGSRWSSRLVEAAAVLPEDRVASAEAVEFGAGRRVYTRL